MLESLIALTVLNCVFMFSSTITTCALWWKYRHHRCCVKKDPSRQTCKSHVKKSKSSTSCHDSKKMVKPKLDGTKKILGTSKSLTNADEKDERKDIEQRKSKSNVRYLAEYKKSNGRRTYSFTDPIKIRDHTIRKKISEASQTTNDTKSTVVMEFSTVQKVVQIVDNNGDISTAKVRVIPARDIIDKNKKFTLDTRNKFVHDVGSAEKISRSTIR